MIVQGVDPGPNSTGSCYVEFDGARPKWISSGNWKMWQMTARGPDDIRDLVVIEWPYVGKRQASKQILATMAVAAELKGRAESLGLPVVTLTSTEVRRALLGSRKNWPQYIEGGPTTDLMVKRELLRRVDGIPKRTNCHERDACAVALIGHQKWLLAQRKRTA